MTTYEGKVAFKVDATTGVGKVAPNANGRWTADNAEEFLDAIIESGFKVSTYSLWIDGTDVKYPAGKAWTSKQVQGFKDKASSIELVLVKRPFPQPKLKLTIGEPKPKASQGKYTLI